MSGECEFINPSNDYEFHHYNYYEYESHYDHDHAEEDTNQCLQSCLEKRKTFHNADGCFFWKKYGQCTFLKTGTIVGASGDSDVGTCWKFYPGNLLYILDS